MFFIQLEFLKNVQKICINFSKITPGGVKCCEIEVNVYTKVKKLFFLTSNFKEITPS